MGPDRRRERRPICLKHLLVKREKKWGARRETAVYNSKSEKAQKNRRAAGPMMSRWRRGGDPERRNRDHI